MMKINKEEYNKVPIFYCKSCLSLNIVNEEDSGGSYCRECGATAIGRTDVELWQEAYRIKYGKDFLTGYDIPDEECEHCEHKNGY